MTRPAPETPARLAERAVSFVERKFGIRLPYNPPSLILVDALVDKIKATGASEREASVLLMGLGYYVGEVFLRHARATWRSASEMRMSQGCQVVALPGGVACDPVGRVFDRFRIGEGASLAAFYESSLGPAMSPDDPRPPQAGRYARSRANASAGDSTSTPRTRRP